jgi:hypothetical protein
MRFVVGGTGAIPFGSEPAPGRRMVSHSLRCRVTITPDPPQRSATMTEPLIWTRDDILRFTHEPDSYDRAWAWDWLKRHHGAEASRQAARAILDPDPGVACTGIAIFASAPTTEARGNRRAPSPARPCNERGSIDPPSAGGETRPDPVNGADADASARHVRVRSWPGAEGEEAKRARRPASDSG